MRHKKLCKKWEEELTWTNRAVRENLQEPRTVLVKRLGDPVAHELPHEITQQCEMENLQVTELSREAIEKIETIEATARASQAKSGAIFLR